jgi:FkbM family methyltransferase
VNFPALELIIRHTANRLGLDLTRYRPDATSVGQLVAMLKHHRVNLVLDIGANIGQFAKGLRSAGYDRRILSFEPLTQAHERLSAAARHDAFWEIAPRMAIGDHEGEVQMHVAGNSVSSSVLDMLETHADAAPNSKFIANERVRVATLDSVLSKEVLDGAISFLKIDTQGYEDRVLDGARSVVENSRGLQLELSFVPLYDGQLLLEQLMARMRALGFVVWGIWPGFCDKTSGRMLQVDVAFFRE